MPRLTLLLALFILGCRNDTLPKDTGSIPEDTGVHDTQDTNDTQDTSGTQDTADTQDTATIDTGTPCEDQDADGYCTPEDCDDGDNTVYPGADEYCDDIDHDCDGAPDDSDALDAGTYCADADGDGYGDPTICATACSYPTGYVPEAVATDCNDENAAINPGMDEDPCNDLDDDCDGDIDESDTAEAPTTWYVDADGDGFGDATSTWVDYAECGHPDGYVDDATDCDDGDNTVYPGADEYCDGLDTDCSGTADDDYALDATLQYTDGDGDGYGDPASGSAACTLESGHVTDATDCDDSDSAIHPAATEEPCNDVDDDCDGDVDESEEVAETYYADLDGDGYGDPANGVEDWPSCGAPSGYVSDATDCDDGDVTIYPGAPEACDGVDSNCDGVADLLGHWAFEDGAGSVASDDGPLGLDGTISGATWSTGVSGGGLSFNGSSDYVLLDYDDLAPEMGITVMAWVSPDTVSTNWITVISRGSTGTGSLGCCGDSYYLGYYQFGMSWYTNTSSDISDGMLDGQNWTSHAGSWHHLAATWDAASQARAIYVDGTASLTDAGGPSVPYYDGAPTRIGADTNSGAPVLFFDGLIDEVKILDCALDSSQVTTDYTDGWPF